MARRKDRSERDRAGVGPEPHRARKLVPLHDLNDYEFADGEPDIRGWDVCTLNGRELGAVEDVLVDPDRREVVMLDVELRDGGVHAEVPIRAVQLDRDRKVVVLDSGDLDRGVRHDQRAPDHRDGDDRGQRQDYRGSEHSAQFDDAQRVSTPRDASANAAPKNKSALDRARFSDDVVVRPTGEEE